jgi:hypothetical protein
MPQDWPDGTDDRQVLVTTAPEREEEEGANGRRQSRSQPDINYS